MNSPRPARPLLFLYFFRLFAVLGAVPFLINTVDILLHFPAPSLDPTFDPVMRFLLGLVVAPLTLIIAGLCIRRAPGNLIGWMLVSFGYGASVQVMRANLLPLGFAVVIANFSIGVFWFGFLLTPLYFPDGQLYPVRANRWGNSLVSFLIFSSLVIANLCNAELTWGSGAHQVTVPNPLLVIEWNYTVVTIPMLVSLIITGIITVILRYRGSRERERLQLRWLLFGVLFQGVLTILTFWAPPGIERFSIWINTLFGLIVPLAVGIAVLRYRLYDIDLIIRYAARIGVFWHGSLAGTDIPSYYRAEVTPGGGPFHPGDCRSVLPTAPAAAGDYRPALLPPEVQCGAGGGHVCRGRPQRDGAQ
jgi:hypothetical protein